MEHTWVKKDSHVVHANPWYSVRQDSVTRLDGSPGDYFVVDTKPTVVVIPFDGHNFYLVNQYRYPIQQELWGFPMGYCESEDVLENGKRELKEETGFTAHKWTVLGSFVPAPGICSQIGHALFAEDLVAGSTNLEVAELGMRMQKFSRSELQDLLTTNMPADSWVLAALQLLHLKG